MALRSLSTQLTALASTSGFARSYASAPTVFDKMVQIFVIDKSGTRHTVRGLEGASLAATLKEYGQFGEEHFMPNPWEPSFPDCHVYISTEYITKLPKLNGEQLKVGGGAAGVQEGRRGMGAAAQVEGQRQSSALACTHILRPG